MTRTIRTCAGIGDNIWLLQKLINTGEHFNFELPDGKPQRGRQVFDILPQVAASCRYVPGLTYKTLAAKTERGQWKDIKADSFYLSCNHHLENGNNLKDFLSDLPISYKLPWVLPAENTQWLRPLIGIYGSAYSTQRAWKQYGAWGVDEWLRLIKLIHAVDKEYIFIIIGAEWDTDFASELENKLKALDISFENTIGKSLGYVGYLMKQFHYAFYFPSGLPIFSESLTGSSDCTMFYTSNIAKIARTWADPERIKNGNFKECLFCSPEKIFEWCIQNKKI